MGSRLGCLCLKHSFIIYSPISKNAFLRSLCQHAANVPVDIFLVFVHNYTVFCIHFIILLYTTRENNMDVCD